MISRKMPNPARRNIVIGTVMLATLSAGLPLATKLRAQVPTAPAQGSWTMKAPLPSARGEVAAVALDGKLHAIGGSVDGKARPFHDEYDPATDRWRTLPPMKVARGSAGAATIDGKIHVIGGRGPDGFGRGAPLLPLPLDEVLLLSK